MAATMPLPAIGKDVTSILLTPQTVNTTTGALADTTPTRQFFGYLQDIDIEAGFTLENIATMDRQVEHMVPIEQYQRLTFTEIEGSGRTNLAAAAAFQASYWKYTVTRGLQSFVGYGVFEKYVMSGTKPRVTGQFSLAMIDSGTALPTYG